MLPAPANNTRLAIPLSGNPDFVRTSPIQNVIGWWPVEIGLFAGALDYKKLPFTYSLILKVKGASEGDFRNWETIQTWTASIRSALLSTIAVTTGNNRQKIQIQKPNNLNIFNGFLDHFKLRISSIKLSFF